MGYPRDTPLTSVRGSPKPSGKSPMFDLATIKSFAAAKTLASHAPSTSVTSIDFSDSGEWMLSSGTDETMQLYDCRSGQHRKAVLSKKYGCHLARFTHRSTNCVYASTKEDDSLRYLNLHDNSYVRYFRGHKNKVISLEVSPIDDYMLSSAMDRTVRVWDLRSPNAVGLISLPTPRNFVTFDAMGLVFAIASQEKRTVALYDVRNFDKQPFLTFSAHHVEGNWQKIEFSNNSKFLVVSTDGNAHGLFDALQGKPLGRISGHEPLKPSSSSPTTFTMDGEYLVGGGNDRRLSVWDLREAASGDYNSKYTPVHEMQCLVRPSLVGFNPKMMLMATADQTVQLWIPES